MRFARVTALLVVVASGRGSDTAHARPWGDPAFDAMMQQHQQRIDGFNQYRPLDAPKGVDPSAPSDAERPSYVTQPWERSLTPQEIALYSAIRAAEDLVKAGRGEEAIPAFDRALALPGSAQNPFVADLLERGGKARAALMDRLAPLHGMAYAESRSNQFTPAMAWAWYSKLAPRLLEECDPTLLGLYARLWDEDVMRGLAPPGDRYRPTGHVRESMLLGEQLLHCDRRAAGAKVAARRLAHQRQLVVLWDETDRGFAERMRKELDRRLGVPWRVQAADEILPIPLVRKGSAADKARRAPALMAVPETRAQGIALASDAARAGNPEGCEVLAAELRRVDASAHGSVFECSVMLAALRAGAEKQAAPCMARLGGILRAGNPGLDQPLVAEGTAWLERAAAKGDKSAKRELEAPPASPQ